MHRQTKVRDRAEKVLTLVLPVTDRGGGRGGGRENSSEVAVCGGGVGV